MHHGVGTLQRSQFFFDTLHTLSRMFRVAQLPGTLSFRSVQQAIKRYSTSNVVIITLLLRVVSCGDVGPEKEENGVSVVPVPPSVNCG